MAAPEKLTIETPEQISLEYTLASAGSRFLAVAIDTLLQIGVLIALALVALASAALLAPAQGLGAAAAWVFAVLLLVAFIVYYGYFAVFEAFWNGQTPGKRAIGLRVITVSGRPVTVFDSIIRNLLRIVDQMPGMYAVGLVAIFLTARNQRLGDLAAGTVVVHELALQHEHIAAPAAIPGVRLGADRLQPNEIEAMETFLKRREDLPLWTRDRTARELARHVRERLAIATTPHASDETFLEELVGEYRSRGGRR